MTGLSVFDTTVQKSMNMIELVQEEARIEDKHSAFQAMRYTLQTLRDRLPVNEAVHVGAQLPTLIAGFYYESWKPAATPTKIRSQEEFVDRVRDFLQDVDPDVDVVHSIRSVFKVLSTQISDGQVDKIMKALPEELQELWPAEAMAE